MKAKCKKCGDTVEVTKLREYKTCKCGAIGLDYGDGYYYRVCGDPEDFDGEIEGAPKEIGTIKVEDPHKPEEVEVILNKKHIEATTTFNEPIIEVTARSRGIIIDNFWSEMAEHFKAIAELCEERSKK